MCLLSNCRIVCFVGVTLIAKRLPKLTGLSANCLLIVWQLMKSHPQTQVFFRYEKEIVTEPHALRKETIPMHKNSELCCLVSLLFLKFRRQSSCPQNSKSLCPSLWNSHCGGNGSVVQHHLGSSWEGSSRRPHSLPMDCLHYCHTQPFHFAF